MNSPTQSWIGLTVTCEHCQTSKDVSRTEIARGDEILPQHPCQQDGCQAMLCDSCEQFRCTDCDRVMCIEHQSIFRDEELCPACAADALEESLLKPFYSVAVPCECCGQPVKARKPAEWDRSLMVGACCQINLGSIPDLPICDTLWNGLQRCQSVGEVSLAMALHLAECPACQQRRKEAA